MITEAEIATKLIIALVLGGLVGLERELDDEPAGIRTHILVVLGAALITILSFELGSMGDPAKVAAGVVTGIGFLGAGTIFKSEDKIRGLTTAASLWVTAAIGMAVGMGVYSAGIITTVAVFAVLFSKKLTKGKI